MIADEVETSPDWTKTSVVVTGFSCAFTEADKRSVVAIANLI
jgi:hypothetical protein